MKIRKIIIICASLVVIYSCASSPVPNVEKRSVDDFEIVIQSGHTEAIHDVAVNNTGEFYATASRDGTILIWRAEDGVLIRRIENKGGAVYAVDYLPDGVTLLACDLGTGLLVWDSETGEKLHELVWLDGRGTDLDISPDGKKAIVAAEGKDSGGFLYRYDTKLWIQSAAKRYSSIALSVAYSGDGTFYLVGLAGGDLICYSDKGGRRIWQASLGADVLSIDASDDGRLVAAGLSNGHVVMLSAADGSILKDFAVAVGRKIESLDFNHAGDRLLAGIRITRLLAGTRTYSEYSNGEDPGMIYLINTSDGNVESIIDEPRYAVTRAVWNSSETAIVASTGTSGNAELISYAADRTRMWSRQANLRAVEHIEVNTSRGVLAIAGIVDLKDTLRLVRLADHAPDNVISGPSPQATLSPDGRSYIYGENGSRHYTQVDLLSGDVIREYWGISRWGLEWPVFSPSGDFLATFAQNGHNDRAPDTELKIWNLDTGECLLQFDYNSTRIDDLDFNQDGSILAVALNVPREDGPNWWANVDGVLRIIDVATGEIIAEKIFNNMLYALDVSPDGETVAIALGYDENTDASAKIYRVNDLSLVRSLPHNWKAHSVCFSPDGEKIAVSYDGTNTSIWSTSGNLTRRTKSNHAGDVIGIAWSPDGRILYTGSSDGTVQLWNTDTDEIATLIVAETDWIVYTPDGYFDASRNGGALIAMVNGMEAFGVDQFALRNNRPDIILERFGFANADIIDHYYAQYLKRLKRGGFTEDELSAELHVPEAEIVSFSLDGANATVNLKFSDTLHRLKRYNIWVNDVPVFGALGKELTDRSAELTDTIELTPGENKVEVSCINENGAESFRPVQRIYLDGESSGSLWYLGFGVSDYLDDQLDLAYAAKDVLDLEDAFNAMSGGLFTNIHTKTYTDTAVTAQAIADATTFLSSATVNDVVVLAVAGHGLHDVDADATYYFLTHDADLHDLAGTAAPFELIENLLQGIAPRRKLFLLDTCESGIVDEQTVSITFASAESRGISARGLRVKPKDTDSAVTQLNAVPRTFLQERDRYIYNDLFRRSGAVVFSSSRGSEFSYESQILENGFFTESLLAALSGAGDLDKNGLLSDRELRAFVAAEVSEATAGAQNPTVDRDNIYQTFDLPIVYR